MSARVYQPGDVLEGYVLQDGDCPFSDATAFDMNGDDGTPDGGLYCGFMDDTAICCARAAYTAWVCGMPQWPGGELLDGVPVALCAGHAEVARSWVELIRIHTVRTPGTAASWLSKTLATVQP